MVNHYYLSIMRAVESWCCTFHHHWHRALRDSTSVVIGCWYAYASMGVAVVGDEDVGADAIVGMCDTDYLGVE